MKLLYFFGLLFLFNSLSAQTANPNVVVENVTTINSAKLDFSPTFFQNGIVFVSNRKRPADAQKNTNEKDKWLGDDFMSLYYAPRTEEGLDVPSAFSVNITTQYHEGPVTFSKDGRQIFFTRNDYKNGEKQTNRKGDTVLKIYTAVRNGNDWANIRELPFNVNDFDQCHPALSADGRTLIFASNQAGGQGGMDLYQSEFINGVWTKPTNLGPTINTKRNEVFPYFHNDGTLYFASNGHGGYGGLDVFSSIHTEGEWKTPTNAGSPINSLDDDFGFILNKSGKSGYFSSSRRKGLGKDDIYHFYITKPTDNTPSKEELMANGVRKTITGVISDGNSGNRLEAAKVSIINKKTGQKFSTLTSSNGEFAFRSSILYPDHAIQITKAGYTVYREDINIAQLIDDSRDIKEYFFLLHPIGQEPPQLPPVPKYNTAPSTINPTTKPKNEEITYKAGIEELNIGTTIVLEDVLFDYGSYDLQITSLATLNDLANLLDRYPNVGVELSAHTDSRGNASFNERLSRKRAESVVTYMVQRGIAPNRLIAIGSGETAIRNGCVDGVPCSENQHRTNRRIEMKIIQLLGY